ncbi:hypothetical protein OIU76_024839, partial [Salix suchowensis]
MGLRKEDFTIPSLRTATGSSKGRNIVRNNMNPPILEDFRANTGKAEQALSNCEHILRLHSDYNPVLLRCG